MEGETSWASHFVDNSRNDVVEVDSFSELNEETDKDVSVVTLDFILPDDLLERILAYLPITSIFRAGSVCKRWHEIVKSKRFLWNSANVFTQKPWYFMFTSSDEPVGYAYDPVLRKWCGIDLPCIKKSNWFVASSCGLVCFMDNDSRSELYVCNPITRRCKELEEPPGPRFSDYSALAVTVNSTSNSYTISIVKLKQVPDNFVQWDVSVHLYNSETLTWTTALTESLTGWRGGDESIICDGVLYFLIYSAGGGGGPDNRHGLVTYGIGSRVTERSLMRSFVAVPCALTCGRLMNLKGRLIMVGGIGKAERPGIIKGIGVWALRGREWEEVGRMPHKYFQGFGELDDVFASSGTDEVVYIQSYGAPALLIFDFRQRQWRWSQKCPVTKRFPLQLFTGFCFEPRLEITP